jgi:hypothetical protein
MIYDFKYLRPYPPKYPPYPPYSDVSDYIEHYFFNFFKNNLKNFKNIERQYLPIFWTTLYNDNIRINVQEYLDALPRDKKYFTINQHDDGIKYRLPEDTVVFSASENGSGKIVPIPLLTSLIPDDGQILEKDIMCSFVGTNTHPIRSLLYKELSKENDFYFSESRNWSPVVSNDKFEEFKTITKRSKFALCPRGNIIQSFRIYEVLQLCCIPVIVTDVFSFPFKEFLDWREFSIIVPPSQITNIKDILRSFTMDEYNNMLGKGKEIYSQYFTLEKTCLNIINLLKQ